MDSENGPRKSSAGTVQSVSLPRPSVKAVHARAPCRCGKNRNPSKGNNVSGMAIFIIRLAIHREVKRRVKPPKPFQRFALLKPEKPLKRFVQSIRFLKPRDKSRGE